MGYPVAGSVAGMSVTVVIPHILPRADKLRRALASVKAQTWLPDEVIIMTARDGECAASVRNRALDVVNTQWIAWLDDDDELLPQHLEILLQTAQSETWDVVYTACCVLDPVGRQIPTREEWGRPGQPFDPDLLEKMSYIPITSLCRTHIARHARFDTTEHYEDWGFYRRMRALGAHFTHTNQITWVWHHDGGNTSGKPGKGDLA